MKNTLKLLFVALAMTAMISCGGGKAESTEESTESTEAVEPAAEETPAPDTTAMEAPADSTAVN